MIAKKYRLSEKEVGKVLKYKKPFFSFTFIANVARNELDHSRFAILLSGKHAPGSVNRNYWRRLYYTISERFKEKGGYDIVLVPKKGKTFDNKNDTHIVDARRDIEYLMRSIFQATQIPKPTSTSFGTKNPKN